MEVLGNSNLDFVQSLNHFFFEGIIVEMVS